MTDGTHLIVVNGPIASGKTTVANALASWARSRDISAAAIDMDDLLAITMGDDWGAVSVTDWQVARRLASALVDRLIENDVRLVALSGPFFNAYERAEICGALESKPAVRFVTLETSLEETLRRCAADETRLTKDQAFVARLYGGIDWKALPRDELYISTERFYPDDVVQTIVDDVGLR